MALLQQHLSEVHDEAGVDNNKDDASAASGDEGGGKVNYILWVCCGSQKIILSLKTSSLLKWCTFSQEKKRSQFYLCSVMSCKISGVFCHSQV